VILISDGRKKEEKREIGNPEAGNLQMETKSNEERRTNVKCWDLRFKGRYFCETTMV
jgi:hypothetical protein